ncbi:hypothetical protein JFU37_21475 [Pseudomonas sp. TH41]|uniref:hypothetical protein n=1 Tax=Pseudomonas sp. TH41 TaxID=2796405 RepID=UPI001911D969|nr:hypothetical protein [Pseudomonas sp. TH41]MBK5355057.1 hypothetical protein [Pseudomonas sp. TH41]
MVDTLEETAVTHKMLSARMLHCAHDLEGVVGAVVFEHLFTDGRCYSVHSSPVNGSHAHLTTEQVFSDYAEANAAYEELLTLLSNQVGPMERQEVPESFNQTIHATN